MSVKHSKYKRYKKNHHEKTIAMVRRNCRSITDVETREYLRKIADSCVIARVYVVTREEIEWMLAHNKEANS